MRRNLGFFVLAILAACLSAPDIGQAAATRISVGGNGVGGVYYIYAGSLSTIINTKVPNVQATVEVCPGSSVEHVTRMQINDIQIGPAMNDVVFQGVKGINRFKKPHDKVRTLFAMYPAELQGASLEKDKLSTPKALIGKRVSIGNPGTGTSVMASAVFEALGIDMKSMKIQNLNWNEGAQAIRNNSLDVQFGAMAAPAPFIMDLLSTHKVALVNFTDEELAKIQAKFEYYAPLTIKAGTYPDIKVDVKTPGIWNSMVATSELSDELAYGITKAVYENIPALQKAYKGADWATPENTMKFAVAPLHPGAIKYYKEKGVTIPGKLMPK
ncbi:MAG: TAXI family TRAP transporter solute-binding subunit [Desulfobacteraceae bacterium]|nr:MAG: TAXI family TRAP transporter solute-binding subunit [Desulfobacteraceae bacterium]